MGNNYAFSCLFLLLVLHYAINTSNATATHDPYRRFLLSNGLAHTPPMGGEDEIVELLWQNNAPVTSSNSGITPPPAPPPLQNPPAEAANHKLYMAEDEMASWLHYPLEDFYSELLFSNPTPSTTSPPPTAVRPPDMRVPSSQFPVRRWSATRGFPQFSMMVGSNSAVAPLPASTLRSLSTGVGSNDMGITSTSPVGIISGGEGTTERAMTVSTSSRHAATTATTKEAGVKTTTSDIGDRKRKRIEMEESFVSTTTTTTRVDAQNENLDLVMRRNIWVGQALPRGLELQKFTISQKGDVEIV